MNAGAILAVQLWNEEQRYTMHWMGRLPSMWSVWAGGMGLVGWKRDRLEHGYFFILRQLSVAVINMLTCIMCTQALYSSTITPHTSLTEVSLLRSRSVFSIQWSTYFSHKTIPASSCPPSPGDPPRAMRAASSRNLAFTSKAVTWDQAGERKKATHSV